MLSRYAFMYSSLLKIKKKKLFKTEQGKTRGQKIFSFLPLLFQAICLASSKSFSEYVYPASRAKLSTFY